MGCMPPPALRATSPIRPEDWYFSGHFKNDPCMPGTLMFEACLQTMAFYLAALGFTRRQSMSPRPKRTVVSGPRVST